MRDKLTGRFLKGHIPFNNTGRVCSAATRLKLSLSHKGKKAPMFGRHHTEASKQKISLMKKGKVSSLKGKIQFCPKGHDTWVCGRTKRGTCRECQYIATLKNYHEHPEKTKLTAQKYRQAHPDSYRETKKNSSWKYQGIKNQDGSWFTQETYNTVFKQQLGRCAVCGKLSYTVKRGLVVDHCHSTGLFRGLLCGPCNITVGVLENNNYESARVYLLLR
jgi:hypothetical protein